MDPLRLDSNDALLDWLNGLSDRIRQLQNHLVCGSPSARTLFLASVDLGEINSQVIEFIGVKFYGLEPSAFRNDVDLSPVPRPTFDIGCPEVE